MFLKCHSHDTMLNIQQIIIIFPKWYKPWGNPCKLMTNLYPNYRSTYTNYLLVQICVMWPNGEHGHYFTLVSMLQLMCKSLILMWRNRKCDPCFWISLLHNKNFSFISPWWIGGALACIKTIIIKLQIYYTQHKLTTMIPNYLH
jgi:hypothetical protein